MKRTIICFVLVPCLLIIFILLRPIKRAVYLSEDEMNNPYVLVKFTATTASSWLIVGDNNGYYETPYDATLEGNYPRLSYDFMNGENTYICYGSYKDDIITIAGYKNKVFVVNRWDVLYPIDHNLGFISKILSRKKIYFFETNCD